MRVSDLDYELPTELIAQRPLEPRDASRLLVFDRARSEVRHRRFDELPEELSTGDLLVLNDSRVVPGRLRLRRRSGGAVELLLLESRGEELWEALARPSRRLRSGERLERAEPSSGMESGVVELVESLGGGRWLARLPGEPAGEIPLPPYIHEPLADAGRYQTVYAAASGSAAAPTAGLHVTPALLQRLDHAFVTLHIGLDTFRPVDGETLEEHELHGERYVIAEPTWRRIGSARRVVAVGTTVVRALESAARSESVSGEPVLDGRTELMIVPGDRFALAGALVTNFHLPRSTLLALVMAFAGVEETRWLYEMAIAEGYRFYSFGDAMLIL